MGSNKTDGTSDLCSIMTEFDDIYIRCNNTEYVFFEEHLFHLLQLGPKHSSNKIWSVLRGLTRIQIVKYLLPVRVAGHCEEYVWLAVGLNQCHGIHMSPLHVSIPPLK